MVIESILHCNLQHIESGFLLGICSLHKAEVQDEFQGEAACSCLFFVDISTLSPPAGTHKPFLIFKGFEWGFGSALGLRAPGAILPAKNKDQPQIQG